MAGAPAKRKATGAAAVTQRTPAEKALFKHIIIAGLSQGTTLADIIRSTPGMVTYSAVYDWCDEDAEFAANFARARIVGYDVIAEDTLRIIDSPPERVDTPFGPRIDSAAVQWHKNRVEQRMKLLAKWSPKKYGDKIDVDHTGSVDHNLEIKFVA